MRIIRMTYTGIKERSLTFSGSTSSNTGHSTCFNLSKRVSVHRNHTSGRVSSQVGILEGSDIHGSRGFSWIESFFRMRSRRTIPSSSRMYTIIQRGRRRIRIIFKCSNLSTKCHDERISRETGTSSKVNIFENGNHQSIYASLSQFRTSGKKSYALTMDSRIQRPSFGSQRIHPLTFSMYTGKSDQRDGSITRSSIKSFTTRQRESGIESVRYTLIRHSRQSLQRRGSHFLRLQKCVVCV